MKDIKHFFLAAIISILPLFGSVVLASGQQGLTEDKSRVERFEVYRAAMARGEALTPAEKEDYTILHEDFDTRDLENPLDNLGGPDAFGYMFVDNQGGDTASYNWIELRGDPEATWLNYTGSHDDAVVSFPLGLTFPFYGQNYTDATVSINGNIQFTTNSTAYTNVCLPTTTFLGPVVFPYWDDLHLDYGGNGVNGNNTIAYKNFGDYVVIEWDSVGHCCTAGTSLKFEVILYANGRIKFQYDQLVFGTNTNTQTIGIQSGSTGPALQYVCNTTGFQPVNDLAILFYQTASGSLSGTVLDNGGDPVNGAAVTIEGTTLVATTDGSGNYSFPTVGIGTYDVTAAKFGYESDTEEDVVITENQNTDQDFVLFAGEIIEQPYDGAPVPITDMDTSYASIEVTEDMVIEGIAVVLNSITHTYDGDLMIWVESPWDSRILLSDRNGGTGENFIDTQFDDFASTPIAQGTAPFTGRFLPDEPLAPLLGFSSEGTWTLVVYDAANIDEGSIDGWTLVLIGEGTPSGTLQGQVRAQAINQPLAGVAIESGDFSTTSDATGNYSLQLPVGTYSVTFSLDGYCEHIETDVIITDGGSVTRNVGMLNGEADAGVTSISHEATSGSITTSEFDLSNDGNCEFDYDIEVTSTGWLSANPSTGSVDATESQTITVTYDATALPVGEYQGTIDITHTGLNADISIPVTLSLASAADEGAAMPTVFALHGNYPNPFNSSTTIRFDVPQRADVRLAIYNLLGQEVHTLINRSMEAGRYSVSWNGRDSRGMDATSGLYIARLESQGAAMNSKLFLVR